MLSEILSVDKLQELYDTGLSQVEIAASYNVKPSTICRLMKKYQIVSRSNSERADLQKSNIYADSKKCSTCKDLKCKSEFYKNNSRNDGLSSQCILCSKKDAPLSRSKRKLRKLTTEQIKIEKLQALFAGAKSRAKKKNIAFSITFDWLKDQFIKQNELCCLTGIKLECESKGKIPFSPSLDQIVPNLGYTTNNCRLVCTAINIALNNFGTNTFKVLAEGFLKNEKI